MIRNYKTLDDKRLQSCHAGVTRNEIRVYKELEILNEFRFSSAIEIKCCTSVTKMNFSPAYELMRHIALNIPVAVVTWKLAPYFPFLDHLSSDWQ